MRAVLCAARQRRVDPTREDYSLAVWRFKAHADASACGAEVQVRDVEHDEVEALTSELLAEPPELLGISCYVWNVRALADLARRVKEAHPRVLVVAGGPAAAYFTRPEHEDLATVDCLVPGDGEAALMDLVRAMRRGGGDALATVPGVLVREQGGELVATSPEAPRTDLDSLASPHAAGLLRPRREMLVEMARGCAFGCAFCTASRRGRVRRFSPAYVAAELRRAVDLSVSRVYLIEPTLNLSTRRLGDVARVLAEADPAGRMDCFMEINPDTLDTRQLDILGAVPGELQFGIGLQSTSPAVLEAVGRQPHSPGLEHTLQRLSGLGQAIIEVMIGLPGDTPERFRRTLDYALGLGISILVFRTIVAPGTELWLRADELGLRYDPRTFLLRETPTFSARQLDEAEQHAIDLLEAASASRPGFYAAYSASDHCMRSFEPWRD